MLLIIVRNFFNLMIVVVVVGLATVQTFADEGKGKSTPSNINIGLVKEYLSNSKGDIIGVVLKDGRRARLPFPLSESALMRGLNPQDGIEVTLRIPVRAEDYQAFSMRSTMDASQGLTNEIPLISNIKNLKTGGTIVGVGPGGPIP
jgi:hypothetical protein